MHRSMTKRKSKRQVHQQLKGKTKCWKILRIIIKPEVPALYQQVRLLDTHRSCNWEKLTRQISETEWDLNSGSISKVSPFGSNFTMSNTWVRSWMTNTSSGNSQSVYYLAIMHLRESLTVTLKVRNLSKMTKLSYKRSILAIWVNQRASIAYLTISKLKVSPKVQMDLQH